MSAKISLNIVERQQDLLALEWKNFELRSVNQWLFKEKAVWISFSLDFSFLVFK